MKKPNIVLILADDQRFDTIAALGNHYVHTPNLDRLVAEGTSFTQAHIPGGTCGAVCMPSRAMLHTGRTLFHLQGEGQEIPGSHILLGEYLQSLGYCCFGTGKWHNGSSSYARSFTGGGEIFFGGMWDHWNVPAYSYDPTGKYERKVPYISDPFHSREINLVQTDHINPGKHSTDMFTEAAVGFLESVPENEPYFLNVAFMAPHDPRSMPEKFQKMYDPDTIPVPENFAHEHLFDFGIHDVRDEILAPYPRTEGEVQQHIAEYYAMISHLDDAVGQIIHAVSKKGQMENTIFIFTGDNGLALGQHGLFGKQNAYEHSIHVPLIFSGPEIPKGEIRNSNCYLFDIFPTLADLLNTDMPESVEGQTLKGDICRNDGSGNRESLYFAYENKLRAVKTRDYKLIEYASSDFHRTQLFDLKSDPFEQNDLSEVYPEKISTLQKELLRLCDEWDDQKHPTGREFWGYFKNN